MMLLSVTSYAADVCQHEINAFHCVKYVSNYDGDTLTMDIPNVHPFFGKKVHVRIKGLDTAEMHSKLECDKAASQNAKKFAQEKLKSAKRIDLVNISKDKYFRIDADVLVDGVSLGKALLDAKLAYPYDGGTKSKIDWCNYK
jgi:endonuclease YncB( thermonuclease family)